MQSAFFILITIFNSIGQFHYTKTYINTSEQVHYKSSLWLGSGPLYQDWLVTDNLVKTELLFPYMNL